MNVTIDPHSGFCFGVVYAIEVAERELAKSPKLYCLGDIVHNNMEVNRLRELGLIIIDPGDLKDLYNCRVLIRAHGEPPATYQIALKNNIELIDASCPIVLHLQNVIYQGFQEMKEKNGQIVIFGKEGHAEVNGLKGQTNGTAIIVGDEHDLEKIDFSRPIRFYSQTTKSIESFRQLISIIEQRLKETDKQNTSDFMWNDSICRQVSNRSGLLRNFAAHFEAVIFVSGRKSSNGMFLYRICKEVNPNTYLISSWDEIQSSWFQGLTEIGVCGATSTPMWLMEEVAGKIRQMNS